jgi:c-di-GMP-binding flagellar brake protein YcgR
MPASATIVGVTDTQAESWDKDRRRHVRVRLASDYDVSMEICEGAISTRVQVVDLSLGGVGILIEPPVDRYELGTTFEILVKTPEADPVRVSATVRHRARGVCGAEFGQLSEPALAALRRAVAELLGRGNVA